MIKKYTDGKNIIEAIQLYNCMTSIDECTKFVGRDKCVLRDGEFLIKQGDYYISVFPLNFIAKDKKGNISAYSPDKFKSIYKELNNDLNNDSYTEIINELHDTYKKKNHDYGDSFAILYKRFGLKSVVIRLWDKLLRLETLTKSEAQVNESIRDTVMDMANYCIMTVMELDKLK
jgi:hypothetical protein